MSAGVLRSGTSGVMPVAPELSSDKVLSLVPVAPSGSGFFCFLTGVYSSWTVCDGSDTGGSGGGRRGLTGLTWGSPVGPLLAPGSCMDGKGGSGRCSQDGLKSPPTLLPGPLVGCRGGTKEGALIRRVPNPCSISSGVSSVAGSGGRGRLSRAIRWDAVNWLAGLERLLVGAVAARGRRPYVLSLARGTSRRTRRMTSCRRVQGTCGDCRFKALQDITQCHVSAEMCPKWQANNGKNIGEWNGRA